MRHGKVRLFLSAGDNFSNDFTPNPVPLEDALEEVDTQTMINPNQLAILIVPAGKTKAGVLASLNALREAVNEGMTD